MAVVKMGQIKSTPAKALAYIARADATADGVWVSTNAESIIDPSNAVAVARQFAHTARRVGVSKSRAGSVLAHHVIQSFDPKDGIDAAGAHRIGVQLAEQITGGSHEYMIATHLDKGHVHNHIIFNAVNRDSGRKFRVQKSTIGTIRDLSDTLCRDNGLSVLPEVDRSTGRSMADIYRVLKGESGKQFIRTEIDKAAMQASNWGEFTAILGRAGVEVSTRGGRGGTLSFREISMSRAVRDYRLGVAYCEASIMARLSRQVVNHIGVDVSMVTRETRDSLTVIVPRSGRQLHLTVSKNQVVRHGRALRVYVPANDKHWLTDTQGRFARTVDTPGLYNWFSEPDLIGATRYAGSGQHGKAVDKWQAGLSELRTLESRVNAKARWMQGSDAVDGPEAAIVRAREFVVERHFAYQTALVAATELMSGPPENRTQLPAIQAQLRMIERDIDGAKSDIYALTQLTKGETRLSVNDRLAAEAVHRKKGEEKQRQERAKSRVDSAWVADDAAQDRDGGTRSMSLQDRLELEVQKMKQRHEGEEPTSAPRQSNQRNL